MSCWRTSRTSRHQETNRAVAALRLPAVAFAVAALICVSGLFL